MNLPRRRVDCAIPTACWVDMAFLLWLLLLVGTVFATPRGLVLLLTPLEPRAALVTEETILMRVAADASIRVDCKSLRSDELLGYLAPTLSRHPDRPIVLVTDPRAPYQAMVTVVDVLAAATDATHGFEVRHLVVPTQSEVHESIERLGRNPLEGPCGSS